MANVAFPVDKVSAEPVFSGREARQAMSVALGGATAARPLGARSGVRPGTPASTVALPTATSYVIHPHAGVLDLQTSALAGPYWYVVGSDGVDETGTVNAAHGTWPRKDILWVRVDDPAEEGTDPPLVVTGYTAGTAAAVPDPPATPARSMRLATISVPLSGGGTPTIVWDAPYLTFVPLVVGYSVTDYTTGSTAATVTFTAVTGRTYRISAGLYGTQITSAGIPTVKLLMDTVEQFRLASYTSYGASTPVSGAPAQYVLVGDGASHTFAVTVQTSAGAFRLAASGVNQLVVEQIA